MWQGVHSFTEWLLNKYLARYLVNVNLHQVHIGLTQGSVELENLKLREDALENFNLPFKIIDGTVGRLELKVPVSGLSSGSLVLCLSNLYILASPYQGTEYDPEKEEEQRLAALSTKLEVLEQQIYQRLHSASQGWLSSFASSYFTSMIENLKLVIDDVHICYEDRVSIPSMPFSLGVTIDRLATQPSASPNKPGDCVLKEVELAGLGVYWKFGNLEENQERSYVLEPISAKVELTQNKSRVPLTSLTMPRFTASLTLQTVQLTLSSREYHLIAKVLNIIDWQRRVKRNRQWHPGVPILGNPRKWWMFAISGVRASITVRIERDRPSFVSARAKLLVKYVNLYVNMLTKPEIRDLIKADITPLEEGLLYEDIYLMRSIALNKVHRMSPILSRPQQSYWSSWVPGWGWGTQQDESELVEPEPEPDAVDYSLFFDKDMVFGKISAQLLHGSVQLLEYTPGGEQRPLVQFTFHELGVGAEYRMKTDTIIMSASLQDIMLDNQSQASSLFPHVVSRSMLRVQQPAMTSQPVLDVYYEHNPVSAALDLLLRVTTQPLDIVYNEDIMDRVTNFFSLDPTIDFVVEAALEKLGDLRSKTKHQLRSTIDKIFTGKLSDFRRWDILLNIHAPLLVLPESFTNQTSAVVVVDLGQVVIDNMSNSRRVDSSVGSDSNFSTPPSTPNTSLPDLNWNYSRAQSPGLTSLASEQSSDNLYEYFSLKLSDLKVHAGTFEEMMNCEQDALLQGKLMDKFSLHVKLERRLVFSLDPLFPNILITATIPSLSFHLDVGTMRSLLAALKTVRSGEKPDRVAAEQQGPVEPSISKSLQSSMKPETLMNTHLLDVKVHVEKISTVIEHGHQLDLEFYIDDVELAYTKRPFDSELSLLISTLTICDRTQPFQHEVYMMGRSFPLSDSTGTWYSSLEHQSPDALIIVEVSEIGPDYPGHDKARFIRSVNVRLNYFDLLPHHSTLAHLLGFFKRLAVKPQTGPAPTEGQDVVVASPPSASEWRYDIKMSVEHVSLGLLDHKNPRDKIGTAAMLGVSLTVDVSDHQLVRALTFNVTTIELRELDNDTCILGLGQMDTRKESERHSALHLVIHEEEDKTTADVHIGCLHYFHSPTFASSVVIGVNNLLLLVEEQISQISSKASEAANRVITYGMPGQKHMYVTVLIESPVIQLPRRLGSSDILVSHLGNITIRNQYEIRGSIHIHQVLVNVDSIHVYSAKLPTSSDDINIDDKPILHNTTLEVVVEQSHVALDTQMVARTDVKAKIPQGFKVTLSKQLYEQIAESIKYATTCQGPTQRVRTTSVNATPYKERSSHVRKEIKADFVLPEVLILLQGDLLDKATPNLAKIKFEDFTVSWTKQDSVTDLYITLHKLNIIDMLERNSSPYKYLFKSRHRPRAPLSVLSSTPPHGPALLHHGPALSHHGAALPHRGATPPPSASPKCFSTPKRRKISDGSPQMPLSPYKCESDMEALVSVRIADKVPDLQGNVTGKCILVDLNCVDMTINLQTWVMLLDFMTISPTNTEKVIRGSQAVSDFLNDLSDVEKQDEFETEDTSDITFSIQMKEWNITLNKGEYPLALCQIEGVALQLTIDANVIECDGKMERLAVQDLSPHAGLYRKKFSVIGNEVLQFEFAKYKKDDRLLERSHDSTLSLHMGSIRYVHTKRFLSETLAFLDHFIVLFTSLQVNRNAVITGQYTSIAKHGERIVLDIEMKSPVVVVPVTQSSAHILVGYPGNITVSNTFRYATGEETLESTIESGRESNSELCLLDCMEVTLRDMDVVSGVWDDNTIKQTTSLLDEKCLLNLVVRRNLDSSFNHSSPNICVRGDLSATQIRLTETDLAKVKGSLAYNLSEDTGEFELSREHITDTVNVHKLDLDGGRCWLDIDVSIMLENVSIELLHRKTSHSLAKFDLTSSVVAFQTYSNKHSVIKLTSRLVTLQDTRPAGGSMFPLVVTHRDGLAPGSLQVEVNMRNTPKKKHWSFVLNKVKVHGIMDFLTLVKVFMTGDVSSPERLLIEHISGLPPVAPAPVKEEDHRDFDINLSIANTEIVLPESICQADSQAVVLQLTTVLTLRQQHMAQPSLSVNFEDIQMYSCTCGSPETALSIMDIRTMSIDLVHNIGSRRTLRTGALLDATQSSALDIQLQNMNTKLSYQDALLFYNIIESVIRQSNSAVVISDELSSTPDTHPEQPSRPDDGIVLGEPTPDPSQMVNMVGIEVRSSSISLVVIDDYGDRDVPLLKILLAGVHVWYDRSDVSSLSNTLRVDYYNSYVSGWEPLIEPWKFDLHYIKTPEQQNIKIDAASRLNLNLTHPLYKLGLTAVNRLKPIATGEITFDRKVVRKPFVPFLIRNRTGSSLKFATERKTHPLNDPNPFSASRPQSTLSAWTLVPDGGEVMFSFNDENGKHRHRESHSLQSRSLRVAVGGWAELSAISVDKVGTFFRDTKPVEEMYDSSPVRIVFDLILEEGARKCITVRSALTLKNNTNIPLEVLLQDPVSPMTPSQLLPLLEAGEEIHVPISRVDWCIRFRPHALGYTYSKSIKWQTTTRMSEKYECLLTDNKENIFYLIAVIERGKYPKNNNYLPGHVISLETPLVLWNHLPVDMVYRLSSHNQDIVMKPSEKTALYDVNPTADILFIFQVEGFHDKLKVNFPYMGTASRNYKMVIFDENGRKLTVNVKMNVQDKYCWSVAIFVKYIIVNLTVYPLVMSQMNTQRESAGQYEEHEEARSIHPFMFDYCHDELPKLLSVRIGKGYRKFKPLWSSGIDLAKSGGFFSLKCAQGAQRPQKVYDISYECSVGTGLRSGTTIIKLVSRYHLENHSSHTLLYGQWYQQNDTAIGTTDDEPVIEALSNSIMPFTWPRNDLDQLLSIRIPGIVDCQWSGGFCINTPQSDAVSMTGSDGRKIFLQCTVVLQRSSYHVVFSDFNDLPSPYRIENHSMVAIQYAQEGSKSAGRMPTLEPGSWCSYYWDEPVLHPHSLLLKVSGGEPKGYKMSNKNYNMDPNALMYETAAYITLAETWEGGTPKVRDIPLSSLTDVPSFSIMRVDESMPNASSRLVLDVPQGHQVLVRHFNPHSPTQLWQVTEKNQLRHYKTKLLLDIPGRAPNPGTVASLIVRSADEARTPTQTWTLRDSGVLACELSGLAVSCRNGILQDGSDAVLDSYGPNKRPPRILYSQLRPGCGAVIVKTVLDGPTKVLQLIDAKEGERKIYKDSSGTKSMSNVRTLLQVRLVEGIGLSLINHVPEELLYMTLLGVTVDLERVGGTVDLIVDLAHFQIDNQCREARVPVVLYPLMGLGEHALHVHIQREVRGGGRLVVYHEVQALIANCATLVDEVLLLKVIQFFESGTHSAQKKDDLDNRLSDRKVQFNPILVEGIVLHETQVNVSVIAALMIDDDLKDLHALHGLKSYLNFSDVTFNLAKYHASNIIAAPSTIQDGIIQHYKTCAMRQWMKVLASSEMTGNMGGLFSDLFTGLSVGLLDGDVPGMVKNVAHGMSDTASKLSATASSVLAYASADETFRANRDRLRAARYQSSSASLRAGWAGLRSGIIGGITSVPTQVVKGITNDGMTGAVTGLAKGIIGTLTKPAAGLLDFASGTTLAITQSTRSSNSIGEVKRARLPRCCSGEILPAYSDDMAQGMTTMWRINKRNPTERFISWSVMNKNWKILISSMCIRLIKRESNNVVSKTMNLENIGQCVYFSKETGTGTLTHYLAIDIYDIPQPLGQKHQYRPDSSPRLLCDSANTSLKISQDIQYAIDLHHDELFIVNSSA